MEGATQIYGNSRAAWFKAGRYYDRGGREIPAELAAQPEFEVEPEQEPVVEDTVPSYGPNVKPALNGSSGPLVDRSAKLNSMHVRSLAKLVLVAGGTIEPGAGQREKCIQWLLDHTTD